MVVSSRKTPSFKGKRRQPTFVGSKRLTSRKIRHQKFRGQERKPHGGCKPLVRSRFNLPWRCAALYEGRLRRAFRGYSSAKLRPTLAWYLSRMVVKGSRSKTKSLEVPMLKKGNCVGFQSNTVGSTRSLSLRLFFSNDVISFFDWLACQGTQRCKVGLIEERANPECVPISAHAHQLQPLLGFPTLAAPALPRWILDSTWARHPKTLRSTVGVTSSFGAASQHTIAWSWLNPRPRKRRIKMFALFVMLVKGQRCKMVPDRKKVSLCFDTEPETHQGRATGFWRGSPSRKQPPTQKNAAG